MYRYSFIMALAALIGTTFSTLAGQDKNAVVTGIVRDAESGIVLENVSLFLSFTIRGTSSGKDGTFLLRNIPSGMFDLVVSRVGYERTIVPIDVRTRDSAYYEIRLRSKPIESPEIEITAKRAGETEHQIMFFPQDSPGILCVYGASTSLPIGIFSADSGFYMYTIETVALDSQKYLRLWLLYKNLSESAYDFDPMACLSLALHGEHHSVRNIRPDPPGQLHSKIANSKASEMISASIDKSLQSMATKQTTVLDEDHHFELLLDLEALLHRNTTRGSLRAKSFAPAREGSLSAIMYSTFAESKTAGLLSRFIVYPKNSVNGYVYFPFPGLQWKTATDYYPEALRYTYSLTIVTHSGTRVIEFIPQ